MRARRSPFSRPDSPEKKRVLRRLKFRLSEIKTQCPESNTGTCKQVGSHPGLNSRRSWTTAASFQVIPSVPWRSCNWGGLTGGLEIAPGPRPCTTTSLPSGSRPIAAFPSSRTQEEIARGFSRLIGQQTDRLFPSEDGRRPKVPRHYRTWMWRTPSQGTGRSSAGIS